MNSIDIDVIRTALDWQGRGHRVVLGTVVRTWGSAPRPPGSLMVIRDDGQVAGSVSGGCIEDDLIGRVGRGELALRKPEVTTHGEIAERLGYADVTTFIEAFRRWKGVPPSEYRRASGLTNHHPRLSRRRFIPR
jgi:AraC-like DNA-binding protein